MQKILFQLLLLSYATLHHALPLSTSSRWIVDEHTGHRVKLLCVNWAAHLEPMLAEGLDKRPMYDIARRIARMGFNCVRLTWATYMFTRYANVTVAQSFSDLGLQDAMDGIARNNPRLMNVTVVEAQWALVDELGLNGIMVVLDNQVSQPMWCCSDSDGNGFFGDRYFHVQEWLQGLSIVAHMYNKAPMVVAMSLRNELRGPHQNKTIWKRHVQEGARTIHRSNPNLLVIVSGLNYDLDFTFLKKNPLNLDFRHKLVYETHRYSFTEGQTDVWLQTPTSSVCRSIVEEIHRKAGFLVEDGKKAPLFVSEFGINQSGENWADNAFLGCFLGYLAEMDLDWSIWALQGSYYLRDGLHGPEETYGLLDSDWSSVRNPDFLQKLQLVRRNLQDPNSRGPKYYVLYHPWSGRCIEVDNSLEVSAGECSNFNGWNHAGNTAPIQLIGTQLCLSARGDGMPIAVSEECATNQSRWEWVSGSKLQLAHKDENGIYLCLDFDPNLPSQISTRKCVCSQEDGNGDSGKCLEASDTQWFKLISTNIQ